jgi:Fe-S cluster assembly protein SufD
MTQAVDLVRQQARDVFDSIGLPGKRNEDWKYSDLSRLQTVLGENWQQNTKAAEVDAETVEQAAIPELDAYRIVFVNGHFQPDHSNMPEGVNVLPLNTLLEQQPELAADLLQPHPDAPLYNGLNALNSATAVDGLTLCVADKVQLDKPLYVLHLHLADEAGKTAALRHGLMLGEQAKVTVIEHFAGLDEQPGLTSVVNYSHLKQGASLKHYRIQQESLKQFHIGRVDVRQDRDSSYRLHSVEIGCALSRADIVVRLEGDGAGCELNGLFVSAGRQHVDHHTRVDHVSPHCSSRENYRSVLDGRSRAVFNGKIVVHEGAIKTDSAQSNANLLLSKHAEIDTKPELEIYNDDVKCAHGATVGQLDDNQLFYLKSRGLSEEEAKQVLTFAFADEVLTGIDHKAVRRFIERTAFAKLPNIADLEGMLG